MPWQRSTPRTCIICGADFLTGHKQPRGASLPSTCGRSCMYAARRKAGQEHFAFHFWERVQRGGPNECWAWAGGTRHVRGYGGVWDGKRWTHSHRVAWALTNGPIPEGMEVCHNCPGGDNPKCCNPAHLFLGTHKQNMADMKAKGRQRNQHTFIAQS